MRYIVGMSLRFRWLVAFAALAVMVFGIAELPQTKVDVFPEFAPPQVEIQTIALGNSSNEVEELITVPLEEQLSGIQGLYRYAVEVGGPAFLDPSDLRAGHGRTPGPSARCGTPRAGDGDAADMGQPALHDAGPVVDEPHHEDRPQFQRGEPD